jgi:hypothetical protein
VAFRAWSRSSELALEAQLRSAKQPLAPGCRTVAQLRCSLERSDRGGARTAALGPLRGRLELNWMVGCAVSPGNSKSRPTNEVLITIAWSTILVTGMLATLRRAGAAVLSHLTELSVPVHWAFRASRATMR